MYKKTPWNTQFIGNGDGWKVIPVRLLFLLPIFCLQKKVWKDDTTILADKTQWLLNGINCDNQSRFVGKGLCRPLGGVISYIYKQYEWERMYPSGYKEEGRFSGSRDEFCLAAEFIHHRVYKIILTFHPPIDGCINLYSRQNYGGLIHTPVNILRRIN